MFDPAKGMNFAGQLEREMFAAFYKDLKDRLSKSNTTSVDDLKKIVEEVQFEYNKHFELFFEPEFKDMSREEFLKLVNARKH